MSEWLPLGLASLTRPEAADACLRNAPRLPLDVGPSLQLRLCEPHVVAFGPDPVRIALRWGEHEISVRCPAELVRDTLRALEPSLAPFEALPPDLAGLLLEAAGLDAIRMWEQASGRAVAVMAATPDATPPAARGLTVTLHDGVSRRQVHLDCTPPQAAAILASWPIAPRDMDWLALPAVLRLGATRLSRGMLASLRPGDAVLLQRRVPGALLVVAESWVAEALDADGCWTLAGAPCPDASPDAANQQGGWTMLDQHADAPPAADPDDIPVTLTFEVGRLTMPLGQLRRLGPGSVIELGRSRHELVEIAAHGRSIGQGELVEIEGAVGVRVVRLFDGG